MLWYGTNLSSFNCVSVMPSNNRDDDKDPSGSKMSWQFPDQYEEVKQDREQAKQIKQKPDFLVPGRSSFSTLVN